MDRFPVWHLVISSYRVVLTNIDLLAGLIGFWLGLDLLLFVVGQWDWLSGNGLFWLLFIILQMLVAPSAVACAWHRYVLLGQAPSVAASIQVNRPALTFIARTLSVWCICGAVILAIILAYYFAVDLPRMGRRIGELYQTDAPLLFAEIMVPLLIVSALVGGVAFRAVLAFPAAAIGDYATTMAVSWAHTKGQTFRLAIGGFACCLPLVVVGEVVAFAIAFVLPDEMQEGLVPWVGLFNEAITHGVLLLQTAVFAAFSIQLYQAEGPRLREQRAWRR